MIRSEFCWLMVGVHIVHAILVSHSSYMLTSCLGSIVIYDNMIITMSTIHFVMETTREREDDGSSARVVPGLGVALRQARATRRSAPHGLRRHVLVQRGSRLQEARQAPAHHE